MSSETVALAVAVVGLFTAVVQLLAKLLPQDMLPGRLVGLYRPAVLIVALLVLTAAVAWLSGNTSGIYTGDAFISEAVQRAVYNLQYQVQALSQERDELMSKLHMPKPAGVILFEHLDYQGKRFFLPEGECHNLRAYWFDRQVTSARMQGGTVAFGYATPDCTGTFVPLYSDTRSLVDLNWNDRIVSLKVKRR